MEKLIAGLILVPLGIAFTIFSMLFVSMITATIVYFIWNTLAPVYFVGLLPAVFISIPWWHCFLFMYLLGILRSRGATTEVSK